MLDVQNIQYLTPFIVSDASHAKSVQVVVLIL